MNRYGGLPIVIADPAIAKLQISGLYTAGDSADFARSISLLLPVAVDVETSRVVLTAAPHKEFLKTVAEESDLLTRLANNGGQ